MKNPLVVIPAYFLIWIVEHPAKDAIRRRLTHMGPSSFCDRLAGSCLDEVSREECAHLFFRVLGRRLVVFEPMTESVAPGLQPSNIKGVMGIRIYCQRDRRALRARIATSIGRGPIVGLADQIIVGAVIMTPGRARTG